MIRLSTILRTKAPPWLTRTTGRKYLDAIGQALDTLDTRIVDGVSHRFPGLVDVSSLGIIGRERRIRRGPGESAQTYANRLVSWWSRHQIRGGPYALLGQLFDFFRYWLNPRIDVVYHSGTRRWVDPAGTITRDSITWEADGSDEWAQIWIVFYLSSSTIPLTGEELVTTWNELITTIGGDPIVTSYTITLSAMTEAESEVFRAIPREWSAAHIKRITLVLMPPDGRLWGYPDPLPVWCETWTAWGTSGATWGTYETTPTILTIDA